MRVRSGRNLQKYFECLEVPKRRTVANAEPVAARSPGRRSRAGDSPQTRTKQYPADEPGRRVVAALFTGSEACAIWVLRSDHEARDIIAGMGYSMNRREEIIGKLQSHADAEFAYAKNQEFQKLYKGGRIKEALAVKAELRERGLSTEFADKYQKYINADYRGRQQIKQAELAKAAAIKQQQKVAQQQAARGDSSWLLLQDGLINGMAGWVDKQTGWKTQGYLQKKYDDWGLKSTDVKATGKYNQARNMTAGEWGSAAVQAGRSTVALPFRGYQYGMQKYGQLMNYASTSKVGVSQTDLKTGGLYHKYNPFSALDNWLRGAQNTMNDVLNFNDPSTSAYREAVEGHKDAYEQGGWEGARDYENAYYHIGNNAYRGITNAVGQGAMDVLRFVSDPLGQVGRLAGVFGEVSGGIADRIEGKASLGDDVSGLWNGLKTKLNLAYGASTPEAFYQPANFTARIQGQFNAGQVGFEVASAMAGVGVAAKAGTARRFANSIDDFGRASGPLTEARLGSNLQFGSPKNDWIPTRNWNKISPEAQKYIRDFEDSADGLLTIGRGEINSQIMKDIQFATGREVGLIRTNDGLRQLVLGTSETEIFVPHNVKRVIAHTHPVTDHSFSVADRLMFSRLGQKSSVLIPEDIAARRIRLR